MKSETRFNCDIFCHVVDNFGDAGVTWRLAQQLVLEFGIKVRLVVDDLASLQKLAPATNPLLDEQLIDGISVHRWSQSIALSPSALVIEAFGCELPAAYIAAMVTSTRPPVWLNLEYLSAEAWVGTHHLLPSIHPQTGLSKYFFFPGFGTDTGGLLREWDLLERRNRFFHAQQGQRTQRQRVFLFGYQNAALPALFSAWEAGTGAARVQECTIPESALANEAARLAPTFALCLPEFIAQQGFDQMLWSHDVLFVRGEDSFVRAQWAAKPFIWHIYPQDEGAHWAKLNAFLDIYCAGLVAPAAAALRELTRAWNAQDSAAMVVAWNGFMAQIDILQAHARSWAQNLAKSPDLATNLVTFYQKTAKI